MSTQDDKAQDVADDMLKRITIKKRLKQYAFDPKKAWKEYEPLIPSIGYSALESILDEAQKIREAVPAFKACQDCRDIVERSANVILKYGFETYNQILPVIYQRGQTPVWLFLECAPTIALTLGIEALKRDVDNAANLKQSYYTIKALTKQGKSNAFIQQCYAENNYALPNRLQLRAQKVSSGELL